MAKHRLARDTTSSASAPRLGKLAGLASSPHLDHVKGKGTPHGSDTTCIRPQLPVFCAHHHMSSPEPPSATHRAARATTVHTLPLRHTHSPDRSTTHNRQVPSTARIRDRTHTCRTDRPPRRVPSTARVRARLRGTSKLVRGQQYLSCDCHNPS